MRKSDRLYEAAYIAWHESGDTLGAIRHLSLSVEADPDNAEARYLLGIIRLGRGEYDMAREHLERAVQLRADNPSGKAQAQNSLGVLYIHIEMFGDAVRVLKEASEEVLNPSPWLAYGNLGWAYTKQGEYAQAETALKRALFDQPQFCVGLYRLGNVYYHMEKYVEARERLIQTVGIKEGGCDNLQEAHHLLGMTYLRLDSVTEAIAAFERCSEINPSSVIGLDCNTVRQGL